MGKVKLHKDRSATGAMTRDGWIDSLAKRDYQDWMKKGYPNGKPEEVVINKPKKERKKLTKKEEPMGKGEKIVFRNGKYSLLPGATREDEMKLIELEIAQRKSAVDSRKESEFRNKSKGEPALKLDEDFEDDEFDDEEEAQQPKAKKLKVVKPKEEKQPSRAMLVFQRALAKGKEVIDSMGDYEGYFHRYGTVIDTNKVQSFKQLLKLMSDKGAMCVEYRKGFGLHMIVGTRKYLKGCEGSSYWSKRGIDVKGLKTTKQLVQLMIKNSACKMEVRDGIPKLLPDFYLNKKTKKRERSGVWIDGKGRNQIAYTAVRVQK